MSKIIYHFTNIAPHYRKNLWEKLINSNDFDFHFFYGKNHFSKIKEIDFSLDVFERNKVKLHSLKNFWFKKKIIFWQSGVLIACLTKKIDVAIFLGHFQILSTWFAMIICKLRGIKVVYWTHGIYGNESFAKKKLRVFFYKTADYLLLYENRAKKLLINERINEEKIYVIYNSLDYDTHLKLRTEMNHSNIYKENFQNNDPVILFVGRLTKQKKIDLIFKAQKELKNKDININVTIIGEGEVKEKLQEYINIHNLQDRCWFYGACYDEKELSELIFNADLCVSPGNVGLTAMHSFSFGTPVCTHNNFSNQMPEAEAIKEGRTGCFFNENDFESLAVTISNWIKKNEIREKIRENCYQVIGKFYNPYNQVSIIKNIINKVN